MVMQCLPTSGFKWIDPEHFDSSNYSSKGCVLEIDFEYPKELCELHYDFPLVPVKIEIKKEMLSKYQLTTTDFYNILIDNVKKLVPNFFNDEK